MPKVLRCHFLRGKWKIIPLLQKLANHSLRLSCGFVSKVLLENSCSHRDEYLEQMMYAHKVWNSCSVDLSYMTLPGETEKHLFNSDKPKKQSYCNGFPGSRLDTIWNLRGYVQIFPERINWVAEDPPLQWADPPNRGPREEQLLASTPSLLVDYVYPVVATAIAVLHWLQNWAFLFLQFRLKISASFEMPQTFSIGFKLLRPSAIWTEQLLEFSTSFAHLRAIVRIVNS